MSEKQDKVIVRKETKSLRRKYGRAKQIDIIERDAFIPASIEQEIRENLNSKRAITATDIALRYDIRVSTVKTLLKKYEEEGLIKLLDPTLVMKIYVPTSK